MYARIGSAQPLRPQDRREIADVRGVPATELYAMTGAGSCKKE